MRPSRLSLAERFRVPHVVEEIKQMVAGVAYPGHGMVSFLAVFCFTSYRSTFIREQQPSLEMLHSFNLLASPHIHSKRDPSCG